MLDNFDYSEVKELFVQFQKKYSSSFDSRQKDLADELLNKLNDLEQVSIEIVDLNSCLFVKKKLDLEEDGSIVFCGMEIKLNPAEVNIPIQVDNTSIGYSRGKTDVYNTEEIIQMQRKLERASVEFYHIADRISHITKYLPNLDSFKCIQIRDVRNHLIEHPEKKDSGVTHDSFSYSLNEGPCIKGLRINGQLQHQDEGFKKNREEFVLKFCQVVKKAIQN